MVTPHQPTHHEHPANPFPSSPVPEPAQDHETVFGARNPDLLIRSDGHLIGFRDGEYRTTHPGEIALLHGVVKDEARGNRGVWVKQLPRSAHAQEPKHHTVKPEPREPAASTSPHTAPPMPTPPPIERREPKHQHKPAPQHHAQKPRPKHVEPEVSRERVEQVDEHLHAVLDTSPPHDEHRELPESSPLARTPRATERGF